MLDFQKRKKKYLDIALHDGTKLKIPTPTMAIYSTMKEVTENPDTADEELEGVVKAVLSSNKQGVKIKDEQLQAFDMDDMKELLLAYREFVIEVLSDLS